MKDLCCQQVSNVPPTDLSYLSSASQKSFQLHVDGIHERTGDSD